MSAERLAGDRPALEGDACARTPAERGARSPAATWASGTEPSGSASPSACTVKRPFSRAHRASGRPSAGRTARSGATLGEREALRLAPSHGGAGFACTEPHEQVRVATCRTSAISRRGRRRRGERRLDPRAPQLVAEDRARRRSRSRAPARARRGTRRALPPKLWRDHRPLGREHRARSRPARPRRSTSRSKQRACTASSRSPVSCAELRDRRVRDRRAADRALTSRAEALICPSVSEASKPAPASLGAVAERRRARPELDAGAAGLSGSSSARVERPPAPRPDRRDPDLGRDLLRRERLPASRPRNHALAGSSPSRRPCPVVGLEAEHEPEPRRPGSRST